MLENWPISQKFQAEQVALFQNNGDWIDKFSLIPLIHTFKQWK
jgi:hypothetical protein